MKVSVEYAAQLRDAAKASDESYDLTEGATFAELLATIASRHGDSMKVMLLDDEGTLHRWILADRSGSLLRDSQTPLQDGDVVRLLSPISGG